MVAYIRERLVSKLIVTVGLTLLLSISTWAYFNIESQKKKLMEEIVEGTDRLTTTIKLGTHYAMMLNSRDEINQIINNIAKQKEIKNIRIYNKKGEIKFSNQPSELDDKTNIRNEACSICHKTDPPQTHLGVMERTRIFTSPEGYRRLGIISPICNEPGCSTDACHVHPEGTKILGALDVVVSLRKKDQEILLSEKGIIGLAVVVFMLTSAIIFVIVLRFVNRPVRRLIEGTRHIAGGEYGYHVEVTQADEMGQLAVAIHQMGKDIGKKQEELNKQRDEYQTLFERAPCMITLQDRDLRLMKYNHEFAKRFNPKLGDHCYKAYKWLEKKCENCPVEKTFADGQPHTGETSGINKDGTAAHWIFNTSPIFNAQGEIIAAMEMSLDITHRKLLEEKLEKSEKKYYDIFNNIPNPVFVLDFETLDILDCNDSVFADYGFHKDEIINTSFLELFAEDDKIQYVEKLRYSRILNQIRHRGKGKILFVNIRISPSDYSGKKVLLITTSDITKRLEAEQQLIHASKMATLGEMASGVAHELNQPLSVIKTTTSFFIRKIDKSEKVDEETFSFMLKKADKNVDRAANIINHMRQFSRKSELTLEKIRLNDVIRSAFDVFSQQLKIRGIEVIWDIQDNLPDIMADPGRLEQVFINLLLNARDAIEEKFSLQADGGHEKKIILKTWTENNNVMAEVKDTGIGFSKEIDNKLFEPFFTTKKVGKGTGLGLSISYGIVNECTGTIRAVSHGSEGASFIVSFPAVGGQK